MKGNQSYGAWLARSAPLLGQAQSSPRYWAKPSLLQACSRPRLTHEVTLLSESEMQPRRDREQLPGPATAHLTISGEANLAIAEVVRRLRKMSRRGRARLLCSTPRHRARPTRA
ncbi:hypothetical protein NL676_036563 [Syzygium grande]|nr:hypothetical protein NL676_036563 [Syzygium grande]